MSKKTEYRVTWHDNEQHFKYYTDWSACSKCIRRLILAGFGVNVTVAP